MAIFSADIPEVTLTENKPGTFSTILSMKVPAGGKITFPKITRAVIKLFGKDANGNVVELDKKDEFYIAYKAPAEPFATPLTEIVRYRPFSTLSEQEQRDARKTPTIRYNKKARASVRPGDTGLVFLQDAEIYVLLNSKYTLALDTTDNIAKQVFELLDVEYA